MKVDVDPELAALEAGNHAGAQQSLISKLLGLARRMGKAPDHQKSVAGVSWKGTRDVRHRKGEFRSMRRTIQGRKVDRSSRPHARLAGAKLVKSPAQQEIERNRAIRAELQRITLVRLIADCGEMKIVAGVPGFRTVWQLSRASTERIHSIPGLGPVRRKKIHTYLCGKGVPVTWLP